MVWSLHTNCAGM